MQTYTNRKREITPEARTESRPVPQAIPAEAMERLTAIQTVDPHAGRSLDLDSAIAQRMQEKFGIRMDQVELRESSQVSDMDARAFAKGNVVQFAPGQFQPDTQQGQHLLEHELAHVAQQARGNVQADIPGLNVNANENLEHQADMGTPYAAGEPMSLGGLDAGSAPVQGVFEGIKKFFSKSKRSGGAERRADAAPQTTESHNPPQEAEMIAVMRQQGFSEDEIQAQIAFQQVNNQPSGQAEIDQAEKKARQMELKRRAHAAADSDDAYSPAAMSASLNYFTPALKENITNASKGKAGLDPTRFLFLRGDNDSMKPYKRMMQKSVDRTGQQLIEHMTNHEQEGLPEESYSSSKVSKDRTNYGKYQDQGLADMDAFLSLIGEDENAMDALRQSADAYASLGDYNETENPGGLTGGRAEAVERAMSDSLLRGVGPQFIKNRGSLPPSLIQRSSAMMAMQSSSMALARGEEKEYTPQELAMHQKLMDFYRRTGLLPD